jgi:hypothetical protein
VQELEVTEEVASKESGSKCQVNKNLRFAQEVAKDILLCQSVLAIIEKCISKLLQHGK